MVIKKENKLLLLELLQRELDENRIDLRGLGADTPGSSFRNFRPYCDSLDFLKRWENLIDEEAKKLDQEKKKTIKRIEEKAQKINYKDRFGGDYEFSKHAIMLLRNNQEKIKKQEEKRTKQEQQKEQAEETKRKVQEEETRQKEQEFKKKVGEEQRQEPKSNEELNELKNKFHEIYQKDKKYNRTELMRLFHILGEIEKINSLDNDFQTAKTELQTIQDKIMPLQSKISMINLRGETTKEKLEEKYLLETINNKLKSLDLEEEIKQLKNQNSNKTQTPQQQAEIQKKIEEKEKELGRIDNKQFQVSSQILSKFQSIPNFNTKEKIEALINPVKDNPEFLQEIKNKYQNKDLNALLVDKSPEEIIIAIK
ncbi:37896_t:CDS:2, partial [Gigaspora margarita]